MFLLPGSLFLTSNLNVCSPSFCNMLFYQVQYVLCHGKAPEGTPFVIGGGSFLLRLSEPYQE